MAASSFKVRRWESLPPPIPDERLPRHVGIIMDGNGRWAQQRGLPRIRGHQVGVESVRDIISYSGQIGLNALTLYAFSTENWKRPRTEINFLMKLLERYLRSELEELRLNRVQFRPIGRIEDLPAGVQRLLNDAVEATARNDGLRLSVALSYGGQDELVEAARAVCQQVERGEAQPDEIDCAHLEKHLHTAGLPPVDLLIRTAGEQRLSNFLLWQAATARYCVDDCCWPDFRRDRLCAALEDYDAERR